MKKIISLLCLVVIFALPLISFAQGGTDIEVVEQAPPNYTAEQAMDILPTIINYAFGFLLVVVVLMIIAAAYMFVTGGGNPDQLGKAKNLLMYALIGLAVALVARGLIALVGGLLDNPITV